MTQNIIEQQTAALNRRLNIMLAQEQN